MRLHLTAANKPKSCYSNATPGPNFSFYLGATQSFDATVQSSLLGKPPYQEAGDESLRPTTCQHRASQSSFA
jgi:hypothetical protein